MPCSGKLLFAMPVVQTVEPGSLAEVTSRFPWSAMKVYDINAAGTRFTPNSHELRAARRGPPPMLVAGGNLPAGGPRARGAPRVRLVFSLLSWWLQVRARSYE